MIRVSVFYPHDERKKFDMDYYCNNHMPMVQQRLGAACKDASVDQGLSGGQPGSRAVYAAIGHLLFDSLEDFQAAFAPHAAAIMGDVSNYTDIEPIIQISDVKM
jgi:uncharacterized protein (TIGR02118 family)